MEHSVSVSARAAFIQYMYHKRAQQLQMLFRFVNLIQSGITSNADFTRSFHFTQKVDEREEEWGKLTSHSTIIKGKSNCYCVAL